MTPSLIFSTSFTIDWISATFDSHGGKKFSKRIGYKAWASDVEGVTPRGYSTSRQLETGALIAWNDNRKDMGIHVQLTGETMRKYAALNVDWMTLLKWIKECGGRTSRVDLAIDMKNSGLQMSDFSEENLLPYKGKGRTPQHLPVGSQKKGWTIYVGARTSTKYLRVYDWAARHDKDAGDYLRIELECKEEIAHAIGWEFPQFSTDECVAMAQTLIRNVANWKADRWKEALDCRDMALSIPQGKDKDTVGWLVKTCAPALAKQIAKYPKRDVMTEFANALRAELQSRGLDIQ
jgi:hypothetical protein